MPLRDAQAGIKAIETSKFELAGKDSALAELSRFIDLQNKLIGEYDATFINIRSQVSNNESQIKLLTQQRDIANGNISQWQREVKKQKTAKWLIGAGGVAAVLLTVLIMK